MHLPGREKVLVHLGEAHHRLAPGARVMPGTLSQEGISQATGIARKHIPRNLKTLLDRELISETQAHVRGAAQRRKVYHLTPEGQELAMSLRQKVAAARVSLSLEPGRERELTLGEAAKELIHRYPEAGKQGLLFFFRLAEPKGDGLYLEARAVEAALEEGTRVVKHLSAAPLVRQFFGRERELKEISALLGRRRMVVVYGITGIGKSALAAHLVADHPESVFWYTFHEWDSLSNLLQPAGKFLEELGRGRPGLKEGDRNVNEALGLLKEGLNRSGALVVLDDSQKATRELRALLEGLALGLEELEEVCFLVLSRQVPDFYNRREVALKKTVGEYRLEGLDRQDSLDLLAARGLSQEVFERIYKLTGGHPLSLELIEAPERRVQVANLEVYFEEEIWRRLPTAEKKVLQQATAYRYPVAPDGLLTTPEADFESLSNLVRHALINQTSKGEYYLHDLLKGFMASRLTHHQRQEGHRQAARFYLRSQEGQSCNEALYHLLQAGDHQRATRVVLERGRELIFKGYVSELHDHQAELKPEGLRPAEKVGLLTIHGEVDIEMGDWPGAEAHLTKALELYRELEDKAGMAKVLTCLGGLCLRKGETEGAVTWFEESLVLCRELEDREGLDHILNDLGILHWQQGDIERARDYLQQSLQIAESADHSQGIARAITNLGIIEFEHGDLDQSIEYYNWALALSETLKDRKTMAQIYDNLGEAYRLKGDREQAQDYFDRGIELAETHGFRLITAHLYRDMAQVLEGPEREDLTRQAQQIFEELGVKGEG